MADANNDNGQGQDDNNGQNNNGANGNGGADGSQNNNANAGDNGGESQGIDISKLTDEQIAALAGDKRVLEQAFQHPRFKELNEQAKAAKKLQQEKEEAEQKRLEQEGKWEEVAKQKDQELQTAKSRLENSAKNSAIVAAAAKAGVTDPNDAIALVDKSKIELDDDGNVTGAEDLVAELVKAKPYLLNNNNNSTTDRLGSGSNPSGQGNEGVKRFKLSQLDDPKFYKENEKEIDKAAKLGLIEDDTA